MAEETTYRKLQKKAFAICRNAGLSRMDRLDFVRELLGGGPLESFNDLTESELQDVCFALEAWDSIQKIRESNGSLLNEARAIIRAEASYDRPDDEGEDSEAQKAPESAPVSETRKPEPVIEPEAEESSRGTPQDSSEEPDLVAIPSEFASTRKPRRRSA